jgi:hypothetical protein
MTDKARRIFISHASDQSELARRLVDELRNTGWEPWLDEQELRVGESWQEATRKGIDESDAFLLLISGNQSASMRFELSEVLKRIWRDPEAVVVPVLVGDAEPPGYLRDHVAVRVDAEGRGLEAVIDTLASPDAVGIERTAEGDRRLHERMAQIKRAADEEAAGTRE